MIALYLLINTILDLFFWVLILSAILSWLVAFNVVNTRNRAVYLVGEASYILYLIHPYIVYGLLRTVFHHADGYGIATIVGLIVLLLAVATAIAVAIHLVFEKPLMEALRKRLLRPRVAKVADQLHEPHAKADPPPV